MNHAKMTLLQTCAHVLVSYKSSKPHHGYPANGFDLVQTLPVVPQHGTETFHRLHLHRHRRLKQELNLVYDKMWDFEDERDALLQEGSKIMDANVKLIEDLTRISRERDGNKKTFEKELREHKEYSEATRDANKKLITSYMKAQKDSRSLCKQIATLQEEAEKNMAPFRNELIQCKGDLKESQKDYAALLWLAEIEQNEAEKRYKKAKEAACGLDIDILDLTDEGKRLRAQILSKNAALQDSQQNLNRVQEALNAASIDAKVYALEKKNKQAALDAALHEKDKLQKEIQNLRSGLASSTLTSTAAATAGGTDTTGLAQPNSPSQNPANIAPAPAPQGGSSSEESSGPDAKQTDLITFSPRPSHR